MAYVAIKMSDFHVATLILFRREVRRDEEVKL